MRRLSIALMAAAATVPAALAQAAPDAGTAAIAQAAPPAGAVAQAAPSAQTARQALPAGLAHAAHAARLQIRHTDLGDILANGRGLTLYMFTRDSVNHDRCVTISGCTGIWPVVTSSGAPSLGAGVRRSLVGRITLAGGARQVTYAGHPLYTYIADSGPGDTSYVGQSQFGGRWFGLTAAGHAVK